LLEEQLFAEFGSISVQQIVPMRAYSQGKAEKAAFLPCSILRPTMIYCIVYHGHVI
jgi:hypothetical protein